MRKIFLCILLTFLLKGKAISQLNFDFQPIDKTIKYWMEHQYYPGAGICIVKNNQKIFQKTYGDFTPDTKICVASAGKWVAAATIAVVVDKTMLSWDDHVQDWLPEFKGNPQGKIKLRQLLSHTSGIPDYLPLPEIDTFSTLNKSVARILQLDTAFSPGKQFQYGGLAMQVAGRMAEVAYGKPFETIFQMEIARALGMKNSHFVPIDLDGGHAPMLGGGLQTSLNDYIQFLNMIYHRGNFNGKQIIQSETVAEMQTDQVKHATIMPNEYTEKAFGTFRSDIYGLGEWREKTDTSGIAYQISSPGWAGAYPWINTHDSIFGFFIAHTEGPAAHIDGFSPFYDTPIISSLTSEIIQKPNRKRGYADIGDAMLYFEESGQGEPLILLHAHSVDRRMWDDQFESLSKQYRVIRYDLRGYGLSSMPAEGKDFTHSTDLKKLMDALKISKAHFAGLSLGSLVITDFISTNPTSVISATLAAGGLSFDLQPVEPVQNLIKFKTGWKKSILKISCVEVKKLNLLIDDWRMWQVSHKESSRIFLGSAAREYFRYNKINIPVLFIVGECDDISAKKAASELSFLIPESRTVNLKNAGHFSAMEQPEEFNRQLLHFLSTIKKSNPLKKTNTQ